MRARIGPGSRALRVGRISIPGQVYCLTTVVAGRRPILRNHSRARAVINVMRELQAEGLAETLAFVVMPDHVHWLIVLGPQPLGAVMRLFKARSARRVAALLETRRAIWQPGFHDHAVRSEENVVALARYIVANPIRAGLVAHAGDYPHWDCVWL